MIAQVAEAKMAVTNFDTILHHRIYRISISDYQILELVELKTGKYFGSLTNSVFRYKRKNNDGELVAVKINVPEKIAQKLMYDLRLEKFELIPDCKNTKGCIQGLDGTTSSFTSLTKNRVHEYSYWEVDSDYYYKNKEIPVEVLDVRKILSIINSKIDLNKQFGDFIERLPKGSYSYGGVNMVKYKNE